MVVKLTLMFNPIAQYLAPLWVKQSTEPGLKYCLLLLDQTSVNCLTHRGEVSLSPTWPLLTTWSESLSMSVKGLGGRAQIMCLFFPRNPPPILGFKSIYLPCKVLIDRELECSDGASWRRASPNRAVMLSLDLPRLNPKEPCFCLNLKD